MKTQSVSSLQRCQTLQRQIELLCSVKAAQTPFLSWYLDMRRAGENREKRLHSRLWGLRRQLRRIPNNDFNHVFRRVEQYLAEGVHPEAQGIALFARGDSGGGFFTAMQFAVPMPERLVVHTTPDIVPLVEVMDVFGRYMLVLVQPEGVEIQDVNLGVSSVRAWAASALKTSGVPRKRTQRWRENTYLPDTCGRNCLETQARMIERSLMSSGHAHLVLAGDASLIHDLRTMLPRVLQCRVVGELSLPRHFDRRDLLTASMSSFLDYKAQVSVNTAKRLVLEAQARGLAVIGADASLTALREGLAEMLVIARNRVEPGTGLVCDRLSDVGPEASRAASSRRDKSSPLQQGNLGLVLILIASSQGVPVKLVDSDELANLGGVGCLLHHRAERFAVPLPGRAESLALVA